VATAVLAAYEYRCILSGAGIYIDMLFLPVSGLIVLTACLQHQIFVASLTCGAVLLLSISLYRGNAPSAMYSLAGEMYICGLLGALCLLRMDPTDGRSWALFVLLVTWVTDVAAYLGGISLGKNKGHKIAPEISPGKSWEGAVCGFVGATGAATALSSLLNLPLEFSIYAGAILGVLAQLGDLAESSIKRFCKVKDSGAFLPGHGGVLDRFDSLLFTGAGGLLIKTLHRLLIST
jgi:phosphatidate cytidylyltransferase